MMPSSRLSRRSAIRAMGALAGSALLGQNAGCRPSGGSRVNETAGQTERPADYTLTIAVKPVELAPNHIISTTTYNGQFPGPLLRLKEGQPVTIDIHNQTDTPEQLHWHGQNVPVDVDGAAEEGTPHIPAHGRRRISFVPGPSGLRFYHTHLIAGSNLASGLYSGQAGPVYIEPRREPGQFG